MTPLSTINLSAWIFFVCIKTSTAITVQRHLTKHQVELNFDQGEDFPELLTVILKSPTHVLNFNFTKTEINYNVPVYTKHKDGVVILDSPPITNAGFYEDHRYEASVTFHCKGHSAPSHMTKSCNIRLISGFFHLDGHKHVIEPEKGDFKRVALLASRNPKLQFIQKHRVYKMAGHNRSCETKERLNSLKNILKRKLNTGTEIEVERFKRSKPKYTIEVLAVITQPDITDEETLRKQRIYYTHVFWGVNSLYKNIDMAGASFEVNLIGFILEPDTTQLYQFPSGPKKDYLNGTLSLDVLAEKQKTQNSDHVVMFSIHDISNNPSIVGLANVGAMCTPKSVSLCRVIKSLEEIHVVAHEIGHSLNSVHDGDNNNCAGSNNYIMAATSIVSPDTQQILNSYKFSQCSLTVMDSYVKGLGPNNCLLTNVNAPIVPTKPTGQLFPPKEQCKTSLKSTGVCSTIYSRNNSDICLSVICQKDANLCKTVTPAYKTTCGNKKWCMFGECVYDINAPEADETCLFGDDENLRFTITYPNKTVYRPTDCPDIISRIPNFCSVPTQRIYCCQTCNTNKNFVSTSKPSSSASRTSPFSTFHPSNTFSETESLRDLVSTSKPSSSTSRTSLFSTFRPKSTLRDFVSTSKPLSSASRTSPFSTFRPSSTFSETESLRDLVSTSKPSSSTTRTSLFSTFRPKSTLRDFVSTSKPSSSTFRPNNTFSETESLREFVSTSEPSLSASKTPALSTPRTENTSSDAASWRGQFFQNVLVVFYLSQLIAFRQ